MVTWVEELFSKGKDFIFARASIRRVYKVTRGKLRDCKSGCCLGREQSERGNGSLEVRCYSLRERSMQ